MDYSLSLRKKNYIYSSFFSAILIFASTKSSTFHFFIFSFSSMFPKNTIKIQFYFLSLIYSAVHSYFVAKLLLKSSSNCQIWKTKYDMQVIIHRPCMATSYKNSWNGYLWAWTPIKKSAFKMSYQLVAKPIFY